MKYRIKGSRAFGAVMLVIGVPWLYYSGTYLVTLLQNTGPDPAQFFIVLIVLTGLVLILHGLSQFIYREEYRIGQDAVIWNRTGWSGIRSWKEPLSRYNGIIREQQYHHDSRQQAGLYQSRMSYMIYLEHEDCSRRVKLYESTNIMESPSPDWERLWKHYAELFNLPLLEKTSEGIVVSDMESRDRPLLDKLVDKSIEIKDFELESPRLLPGLSLQQQDGLWVISVTPVKLLWSGITFLSLSISLFTLAFVFEWFPDTTIAISLGALVGISALLYLFSMWGKFMHPDQVAVDKKSLWYRSWDNKKQNWNTENFRISNIRRIALGTQPNRNQLEKVIVESDRQNLEFGERLPAVSRAQLRDLLIYLISLSQK